MLSLLSLSIEQHNVVFVKAVSIIA